MKNIHIISTDKPSRLAILGMSNNIQLFDKPITFKTFGRSPQNIYITNDKEIKDGDYYLYLKDNKVYQFIRRDHTKLLRLDIQKKIILTTDQELIKDGVQPIDDKFLEWFVKNPSCEEVEVKKGYKNPNSKSFLLEVYKIYVPTEKSKQDALNHFLSTSSVIIKDPHKWDLNKQELPQFGTKEFNDLASQYFGGKQETLEEAAERLTYTDMLSWENILLKVSFIAGAKWEQQRSYSEEDMEIIEISSIDANYIPHYQTKEGQLLATKFNVKQFKKK